MRRKSSPESARVVRGCILNGEREKPCPADGGADEIEGDDVITEFVDATLLYRDGRCTTSVVSGSVAALFQSRPVRQREREPGDGQRGGGKKHPDIAYYFHRAAHQ